MPVILSLAAWIVLGLFCVLAMTRALRRERGASPPPGDVAPHLAVRLPVAALFGLGGGAAVVHTAGPAALPWMLVGGALGVFSAAAVAPGHDLRARVLGGVLARRLHDVAGAARVITAWCALALTGAAVMFGARAAAGAITTLSLLKPLAAPLTIVGGGLVALAWWTAARTPSTHRGLRRLWTGACGLWVLLVCGAAAAGPSNAWSDAWTRLRDVTAAESLGLGPLAGLGAVAVSFGLFRGMLCAWPCGLNRLDARPPLRLQVIAALVPVLSGGALVLANVSAQEVVDTRTDDGARSNTVLLGPVHARGLLPNLERGQIIVLPEDTPLAADQRYPMRLQAPPRGATVGVLEGSRGFVRIPDWKVLENANHVWFRPKEPQFSALPSWDLKVPMIRERVVANVADPKETAMEVGEEVTVTILRPADPEISLAVLASRMDGPYLPLADLHFEGSTARAVNDRYGEFIAMYEVTDPDRPTMSANNPTLREAISIGYSGPFFDTIEDEPPLPVALVGREGRELPVGRTLALTIPSPRRGLKIGRVIKAGVRELATPAWAPLASVRLARLRHDEDPSRDILIPVRRRLAKDGTFRFASMDPQIQFGSEKRWDHHDGPFLEVPPFFAPVTVYGDARLPAALKGRQALVPTHPEHAPVPPPGDGPFMPHPVETQIAGMPAPVLAHHGVGWLAHMIERRAGTTLAVVFFVLTLAVAGMVLGDVLLQRPSSDVGGARPLLACAWVIGALDGHLTHGWWALADLVLLAWMLAAMVWAVTQLKVTPRSP